MSSDSMIRPESEKKVADMFDRIAPKYDFMNKVLSARQDIRWRKHLLAKLPVCPNHDGAHLDIATGTGDVLLASRTQRQDYRSFEGVDISANMLKQARIKAETVDPTLQFKQMSAENLLFENNSFHAVSISFGLRNVVRKRRALEEMYRVLKPSGRALILEFFEPHNGLLAKGFMFYFHHILPRIGGALSDKLAYQYLPKSVESFYSGKELKAELEDIGFKRVTEKSFLFGACRLVTADRP